MTDDDPTPEIEQAFTDFDDVVDALPDDVVEYRLARTLGRIPAAGPAGPDTDAYLDVALQRGQEVLDQAHEEAREILARGKQRVIELIADAGSHYSTDGLGNLWPDDTVRSVAFAREWIAGSGPADREPVEEFVGRIDDPAPNPAGRLSRDETVQILRTQMFGAYRHATVIPESPDDPDAG